MNIKNVSSESIFINKSVQIDINTPHINDGYILEGQTIDLSKSMTYIEINSNQEFKKGINNGDLVFVLNGLETDNAQTLEIYNYGLSQWAEIFNPVISKSNLYEGLASGFIYVKNCLIG